MAESLGVFSDEFQCRRCGVQFRRGSPRFPIPSVELHEAPHPVVRGRKAMLIGTFLVTQLGAVHLNPQVAVDFGSGFYGPLGHPVDGGLRR